MPAKLLPVFIVGSNSIQHCAPTGSKLGTTFGAKLPDNLEQVVALTLYLCLRSSPPGVAGCAPAFPEVESLEVTFVFRALSAVREAWPAPS